jgi:hypothetical protein
MLALPLMGRGMLSAGHYPIVMLVRSICRQCSWPVRFRKSERQG